MTLDELIKIASSVYSDNLIEEYHKDPETHHGDLLAKFIAAELTETFDPEAASDEQLDEAHRVLDMAQHQLGIVVNAIVDWED